MSFTYNMIPVDIVELDVTGKHKAAVRVKPYGKCEMSRFVTNRQTGESELIWEPVDDLVEINVARGRFGWYANAPWRRKREDGSVYYIIKFYDVRERMRSAHVLAGVAAMVAHAVFGDDYRKGAKALPDGAGCHNCWNLIRGSSQGEALDYTDHDGESIRLEFGTDARLKPTPINYFCQSLGKQILQEFDEEMAYLETHEGDRYGHLHNFKGKFEYGGRLVTRDRLFEQFAIEYAHTQCGGCHIWSLPDSSHPNRWITGTPRASNAHFSTELLEIKGQLYKLPTFQIGGMLIRRRWDDVFKSL